MLTLLLAPFWVLTAAPVAAGAAVDDGQTLKSALITFDTSARSALKDPDISINIVVTALAGDDRTTIADKRGVSVERKVDVRSACDLVVRGKIKKEDIDGLATMISLAKSGGERWVFHYTLTLTFETGEKTSTVVQKKYAVILDEKSPEQVTKTWLRYPSKRKSKGSDIVFSDKSKPVRQELEKTYAALESAIEKNDGEAMSAFQAADFSAIDSRGRRFSAEQMADRGRQMQRNIRQPVWTHNTLETIVPRGDEATVTVRQAYSRMQMVNGKLRKVETSVTQDETWVSTPQGWKRRFVQNEKDQEWYVDGKRIEPGKPYDENAPAYEPKAAER
jgi:hypothetical protein